ncbi:hypothetical protein ACFWM3_14710 [Gottfriedia sp. NPDC058432]|uniref:hypothetical protein n=1 Tax=Gottfriedia sp. NPDC058432 TaxID=3346497 RepID=UPI003650CAAE
MRKRIIFVAILTMLTALILGACSSAKESTTKEAKYKEIPQSAIQSTVGDMKTRENIKDATFEVKGNKINMTLTVDDAKLSGQSGKSLAQSYADSYLRVISNYVDGSNPKSSGDYGKVYDGYFVNIVVVDSEGFTLIEGEKYPSFKSVTWK